jgi:hypothetical protein
MIRKTLLALPLLALLAVPVHAQTAPATASLLNPVRLGIGARVYREWNLDSNFNVAASPDWRVGVPLSWLITSTADPAVKHPFSITGAADYGLASKTWRFQVGGTLGLKIAGVK